jgi:renalase
MEKGAVCVVGAGISGLICARTLADRGYPVTVFEKSREVGGRMSAFRTSGGIHFDHGAPYFTVQGERFRSHVEHWIEDGIVLPWQPNVVEIYQGRANHEGRKVERFVATPGMNEICRRLAEGLDVRFNTRVAPPVQNDEKWSIQGEDGEDLGRFDTVLISAPAPLTAKLLTAAPLLVQRAVKIQMAPSWVVTASFEEPVDLAYDAAFIHSSPLTWIARNSGKPGQAPSPETWVLQATPAWTVEQIEKETTWVVDRLLAAFHEETACTQVKTAFSAAHLWNYAVPPKPHPGPFMLDEKLFIGACGDWCGGPRVEGAFLSGVLLAERLCELGGQTLIEK